MLRVTSIWAWQGIGALAVGGGRASNAGGSVSIVNTVPRFAVKMLLIYAACKRGELG